MKPALPATGPAPVELGRNFLNCCAGETADGWNYSPVEVLAILKAVSETGGSVTETKRKQRLIGTLAAAGLLATPLAAGSGVSLAASQPTVTVVDTVSGPNFQAFWKTVLIPEIKKDLGINVNYTVGSGPEIQLQMKAWKQGQPVFSLLFLKGLDMTNMIQSGNKLTTIYPDFKTIPNERMEPVSFLKEDNGVPVDGKGVLFWRAQFDLVYNAQKIKHPPHTWQQFYADRQQYCGHIGMIRTDAGSGGGRAFMYSFLQAFGVDFNQPFSKLETSAAWKSATAKFKTFSKCFAQPAASSPPVMFHQFSTGQVWLTDYAQDYSLWSAKQGQLPEYTKAAPLNENVVGSSNAWLVVPSVDTAAQKATDKRLINFLISPHVQLQMLETMYEYPGTSAWTKAPAWVWKKIPPVNVAEGKSGIRMTNLPAITYIEKNGMNYVQ